jgi:hypothetical protein
MFFSLFKGSSHFLINQTQMSSEANAPMVRRLHLGFFCARAVCPENSVSERFTAFLRAGTQGRTRRT